jgi:aryl-alcohol dehydrogenase-like predicted oxidoreductase
MRQLGSTGIDISVVGIGGWQMGGLDTPDGIGYGRGDVDDDRSIRIIHRAEELCVKLTPLMLTAMVTAKR